MHSFQHCPWPLLLSRCGATRVLCGNCLPFLSFAFVFRVALRNLLVTRVAALARVGLVSLRNLAFVFPVALRNFLAARVAALARVGLVALRNLAVVFAVALRNLLVA